MSCVNRSSKEFKFLAERNNLSINALELITHKYWLENKTEDYFPSDVYIQAQLGKIPYEEPSKPVRDLWEMKYKEPQTFKTLEALEDARKEALRYFPEEAVTYHMDFKDNFVMVVRKPIAKMSLSVSDLTGKSSHEEQELADYDLITGNIIQELNNNRNFAEAENLKRQVKNTQLENTLDAIDKVAKSGKWDENTLQQLNNLTNNIKDGKVTFKRFPGRVHEAYRKMAGGVAAGAWLLFARDGRTMEEKSRTLTPKERYAREEADKPGQEKALVAWAKAAGVWYEDASIPVKGMEHKKNLDGGEAMIYAKDAHTYRKLISNDYFVTPQLMLDRIVIHNALSPAKLTLQGFTQDNEGNLLFIVDQPIVEGITPTKNEINDLANLLKLEKHPRISGNTFISKDGTLYVSDLHDENVIKNANGDSIIIDTEARLNTPDLGKEGTYIPDNSLEYTDEASEFDSLQMSISSPQTFTFKDGTTVKAPFKPNYQQVDALNAMDEFIKSDKTSMTLSGYAGTGKTSLMEMLAQKMDKQHKPIMFCASTNKAAAVLKERVSKSGFDAFTLNKVFGIAVEVDPNQSYNAKNLVNKLKDVDILAGTTIIIDEASMINEENYDILNSIAQRNGLKIIYVGDAAQLAPVNETKISKVFRDQNHEVRTLSIVERTGDNAILKEATALRDGEALSGESSFNSKGQGVAYIKNTNVKEREAIIRRFIPELRSNPNYFRILAYTNAAVAAYNTQVRQLLGYNDSVPRVGEPITGYANWGYIWDRNGGKYRFINSEAYKVIKVESPRNARITLPEGTTVTMQAIPITLENSLGERDTFNFMDIKGNQENRAAATQLAQLKSELWSKARKSTGETKSKILQQINEIDKFLFVNDNITEGKRTLQAKVFDFGYAMTVHKSQGSTFTHVLMDDVDINKAKGERNTGIGAEDIAINWEDAETAEPENYEITGEGEDIEIEGWEDETFISEYPSSQPANTQSDNAANVRQQLKYVAVSRATDTVTIISDNVKKEDSPLNHINEAQVSEASPSENNPATPSKPVEQMSSKEVWNYLSAMQPLTKRSQVEYTPQGQARQTYTIEDGHIYNSKGTEVYPGKTVHNMILANHAVKEGLAVVVEHPTSGEKYVVDNNQQITSVRTGKIMQWGEENGDRRRILTQAEKKFRDRITATKERGNTLNEQLLDYLQLIGIDVHNETEMAQYLREHGNKAIQQAIAEQQEMQEIKAKAQADGTFMKAPNGKDTNLTERQWLQVRTKAFKNWFGDWERVAKNKYGISIGETDIAEIINEDGSINFAKLEEITDRYFNTADESLFKKGRKTLRTRKEHHVGENNTLEHLQNVVRSATEIDIREDLKPQLILAAALHDLAKPFHGGQQHGFQSVDVINKVFKGNISDLVKFAVRHHMLTLEEGVEFSQKDADRIMQDAYDNGLNLDDAIELLLAINTADIMMGMKPEDLDHYSGKTKKETIESEIPVKRVLLENAVKNIDNSASKVIDENDEPLVVYHGTNIENISIFNRTQIPEEQTLVGTGTATFGNFFSDKQDDAKSFANIIKLRRNSGKATVYDTFLNIKNPMYFETLGDFRDYSHKEGHYNENGDFISDVKLPKEYDGVIVKRRNSRDDTKEFVAPNPNQIKSATDNNGMFSTENDDIQAIQTPEGEIKGFATPEGSLYFDRTVMSPEHSIHEYTHLWDRVVAKNNPELWNRGITLMKQISLWKEIENDENYGKKWKDMKGMTPQKLESLIASEVHSRLAGVNGEQILDRLSKEKGQKGIIGRLKQWLLDFWKDLKGTFSNWSQEDLDKLTLQDFTMMTIRNFADGFNPNTFSASSTSGATNMITQQSAQQQALTITPAKSVDRKATAKGSISNKYIGFADGITGSSTAEYARQAGDKANVGVYSPEDTVFVSIPGIRGNAEIRHREQQKTIDEALKALRQGATLITDNEAYTNNSSYNEGEKKLAQALKNVGAIYSERTVDGQILGVWKLQQPAKQQSAPQQAPVTEVPPSGLKVSLPGYEYFTEATEDTPVDAEWKIPYLQELDSQLNINENPTSILEQMHAILEATSEEGWLNKSNPKAKEQVAKTLDEYDKLITQLNNLLDSNLITASEVRHTAELVVNAISDNISQLQKEKGLAEQQFPTLNSKLDFQTASRKDIIKTVGIERLIYRAKLLFDPKNNEYEDRTTLRQAKLIMENWDAIMTLASDIFAMNEGMGITKDFENGNWKSTEGQKIDFDNFNDYENDPDAMAEETKDEQEHWQIEQRTIDILNSMSAMVRLALHECYQVDREGNTIKSKWGIPERVNSRKAVNSILRWTQGSLSLEDMVSKLSAKQNQNPWLSQLITRLTDKSGNETDFQSQFYGVFSKHFQLYSVVLLEDGKYHSIAVNSHPALTEAIQTITTQFRVGEHPLFTSKGINKTLLGNENTTGTNTPFNLHKALTELQLLDSKIQHGEDLTAETVEEAAKNVTAVCRTLGYTVTEELVADIINENSIADFAKYLGFMVNSLDKAAQANKSDYDPFAYNKENSIGGTLRNFLTPITDVLEDTATNAFYDSGKMYQSYVTPSFMTKLLQKFRLEGQAFEDFLDGEYGSSEWFKFKGRNGAWRNEWLRILATNEDARKVFDHKVELNFNKHNYMRNMSDAEYTLSLFAEYFTEHADEKQEMVPAWFRIPMQSNKPSSEFIKFYSYRGSNYKNNIVDGLYNIFLQELSRIQTVNTRNRSKKDADFIKNFDTNGRKFNFLPFLNNYLENTAKAKEGRTFLNLNAENAKLARLLQKKVEGVEELTAEEEGTLIKFIKKAIYNHTDGRAQQILNRWEQEGILEAAKKIEGVGIEDAEVRNAIENYIWNDTFAAKNILQLTVGDIAFYKDAEDLQKRLAQLHAPGTRGNIAATDYNGNRVSDGFYRTFILQDFDTFKSNIIANIAEVFDRKIAAAPESQKAQLRALKESLVGENGKYTKINVTDAQGYSSPSSYRKKAFMFGRWSHKAEDIYQKLLNGDYNYTDLEVAFQPLKPFVYTHLEKHIGDGTPIETMKVPFQAKNSEYLLIMADAIMQSEVNKSGELSRPNLLRAVYRVMEDSKRLNPTKGIDTVQFESAIKSGLQGKMNIHQFAEVAGGEEAAYTFMMSQIYQNYDPAKTLNEQQLQYNTDTFVHEASYEDYCLQQEVPEHFKGHQQAHGSQIRMIIPSDLDLYRTNAEGERETNYYEWTEPDGTKKKVTADEFKREYEHTIADNIEESIDNLSKELHLDSEDKKERNIALSKILLREILSSPRYGIDLAQACAVDKATGEFRIPKGDPIQAKRIEQLINSIIKNRVNKQKIAGGPIVQVTNFGTSKQLHIRFNARSGGLLKMENEFIPDNEYKTYEEYKKAEQGGIAYFEVFIPIWANEIFEKFANEDGTIDVKAIEAVDPDLLKMISYRIPTEDKYSCAPMKAVGFMPREAGDAIMLPWELTEIDDSDFDVDKRYVMRKDIKIKENDAVIEKLLIQKVSESYAKAHNGKVNKKLIVDQVKMYMDNPDRMKTADKLMETIHAEKQLIMKQYKDKVYRSVKPKSGKVYRDNKIVDMTWAVLTNEMTADKILNPGGFDNFKKIGYAVAAYKLNNGNISWDALQDMSIEQLNDLCYVDKDLTWADTQVQFYKQNAAAASLIGVFAVNKVAHATLEGDDVFLAIDEVCGEEPFTIGSTVFGGKRNVYGEPLLTEKEFKQKAKELSAFRETYPSYEDYVASNEDISRTGRMQVDPKYDHEGNLIGKTLGSGVSASADAAKTPVLNLLNINMTTVGTFTSLLRLGMPHEDACLFIGQDVIARVLDTFNRENLTGYTSLNTIISKEINRIKEEYSISDDADINTEPLTRGELIEGLTSSEHDVIDYKVLNAFQKVKALADSMRKLSFATRFNSISSAVGPLIIDNLIMEHKMEQFMDENEDTHFYTADGIPVDITDVFADHPILNQFSRTVGIARQMTSDMPAGSTGFRQMLSKLPEDVMNKIYNDKKLFSKLSDFYQSYLAIASGLVNAANLKRYIDGFPKWFMKEGFKEKYPDNALIQNIEMTVSKKTGRAFLSVKLTGEDETLKETYRNAWIDLHKTNPELSQQLFEYCFFRAGIGFSPKTFMAVVPTYVKERLQRKLDNGNTATYLDTYRRFPSVPSEVVIDQFIANNWSDNKLVPRKGGKDSKFIIKGNELYATLPADIMDLEGLTYIKTVGKEETSLWKLVSSDENGAHYTKMKPLGDNGEYLEMSLNRINNPMTNTTKTAEDNDASEIKTTSQTEIDATEEKAEPVTTENKRAKAIAALARDFMAYNETSFGRKVSDSKAAKQAEDMVDHPERFGGLMQNILKSKGIEMSKDEAIKKLKELDLC